MSVLRTIGPLVFIKEKVIIDIPDILVITYIVLCKLFKKKKITLNGLFPLYCVQCDIF